MVGQLEQPPQARVQEPRLAVRVAGDVQVGPADVADQQRVAAEHQPRLVVAAAPVGDRVGVMGGRVAGRRDRRHDRVAELDHLAVGERDVLELDPGARRQVGGRAGALDERRQPGDVVGLHVRLEHRDDRRADRGRRREVVVDEIDVRVDDRELAVRRAAEQVAGAGAGVVQERVAAASGLLSARDLDRQPGAPPLRDSRRPAGAPSGRGARSSRTASSA